MDTNLATIQEVTDIQPIPGADSIEVASVMGWKCVVKKGEFKIGDKGVYIAIDTIVPEKPEFEFLRKVSFRVKTIRLRKQLSQGLLIPLTILPCGQYPVSIPTGTDVTEVLGIKKYEKPVPAQLAGLVRGDFPSSYIHKTDEIMLQNILPVLDEIRGQECYISVKLDGTSATFVNTQRDSEVDIHVCSRNLSLKETEENVYWKMLRQYHLDAVLAKVGAFAIQGEVVGEGIQKNRLGIKGQDLYVFNVFDIKNQKYLNYKDFIDFCATYGLKTVPIERVCTFDFTFEQLLEMAKGKYASGKNREGIVIRPTTEMYSKLIDDKYGMRGRLSFKVLNNDYLEKDED
jgi:RNA ligase (TIGR02306 family)